MSSFLILCGESTTPLHQYDNIAVINVFLLDALRKNGIGAVDLFGIDPEIDEVKVTHEIDFRLHQEAEIRTEMRWAPLALERTARRYLHYLQFKRRIEKWLAGKIPTSLVISSGWDKDLVTAARVICKARGISLTVQHGSFDIYSGLQPFLSTEMLPSNGEISSLFLIKMSGWIARLRRVFVFYEPYSNITANYLNAQTFRWWKSIAILSYLFKHIKTLFRLPDSAHVDLDLSIYINPDDPDILNPSVWSAFSNDELKAINSGMHNFRSKHSDYHLDQIYIALKSFFRTAKAQRLIVLDVVLSHSRMLIYAAKHSKMYVDLLPHGLTSEDYTRTTVGPFSPDRVLAWNEASRDRHRRFGMNAIAVSHERNRSWIEPIHRKVKPIKTMNVLVLLSSSVPLQLDALERDFLDMHAALVVLGVERVKWKSHSDLYRSSASHKVAEARNFTLQRLDQILTLKMEFVDLGLDTQQLMRSFDMVVMAGPTSGIFEAARFGVPFVIFGGQLERVGSLDGVVIPHADSKDELVEAIRDFDYKAHRTLCRTLRDSLIAGKDPFGML
jgi:hypothetical protein